ncbi:DUF1015 family protein [Streptomyces sp. NPDC048405]|uniref:DUF1015 family protein n=1 Tax=Streptomyces TaxID=1883 RepID=UPI000D591D77|nr:MULTISPECIES: DUF1015 domain-containing protein [Streptomyces]MBU6532426.1 DUF1015 domain-containing protein [Streptomyces sp. A108]
MSTPAAPAPEPTSLRLRAFRAVRYDEGVVGDLSRIVAPPQDDHGRAQARSQRGHPYQVTRLLYTQDPQATARQLRGWLHRGVLRRDERPAVYVYQQQRGARILQRGLIGELSVPRDNSVREERLLLPHEAVSPQVVEQRAAHMSGLRAQLEPLLLTHSAMESVAGQVMEHVIRRPPAVVVRVAGITHTLWVCDDDQEIDLLTSGVSRGRALIADGHHRHAACLHLGRQPGSPWRNSLALLIDTNAYPLRLSAIHRVLPGLDPEKAASLAANVARVLSLPDGPRKPGPNELVLVGAGQAWSVTDPDPMALREALASRPREWAAIPAAVGDHLLLDTVWAVPDLPGAVRYSHDVQQAVADVAAPGSGTALLLPATTEALVRELAGAGVLMPRKSTSFGPKPAVGLALRVLGLP